MRRRYTPAQRPGGAENLQLTFDNTTLAEAIAWRDRHPEAWRLIIAWAHEDAPSGRCSMQGYLEALRSAAIRRRLGLSAQDAEDGYAVNHNLRTGLTRLAVAEHPHLPFRQRASKCDAVAVPA